MKLPRFVAPMWDLDTYYIADDFDHYVTADTWTTDSGTVAAQDLAGGRVNLLSGAVANNYCGIYGTQKTFKLLAGRNIYARAKLQYTDADTSNANIFVGFDSTPSGGGGIVNGGASLRATGMLIGIAKLQGTTAWRGHAGNGTTPSDTISNGIGPALAGVAQDQILEIEGTDQDGVNFWFVYKVNGEYLKDVNNNVIRHSVAISGAAAMTLCAYVKAGSAFAQTLVLDWLGAIQCKETGAGSAPTATATA